MYAVIESGGKQLRVKVGDVVRVDRLEGDVGAPVVFDRVLMLGGDESVQIGSPVVESAQVRGSIVEQDRHKKILIYTYKPRQNSNRRRQGHRQDYTAVKIEAIES
jgi:large subunit ribosomal protein L21